jgi:hypothetical protein
MLQSPCSLKLCLKLVLIVHYHEQKVRAFKVEQSEQLESAIIVCSLVQDLSRLRGYG